jgi:hypothetical protein
MSDQSLFRKASLWSMFNKYVPDILAIYRTTWLNNTNFLIQCLLTFAHGFTRLSKLRVNNFVTN